MGRGALAVIVILAPILCLIPLAGVSAQAEPPSLARSWFEEARLLAGAGDWAGAMGLLAEGIALDPMDSDSRYLASLASMKTARPGAEALAQVEAAIASGRFLAYSIDDARLLRAELLLRSRRWQEALSSLGQGPGASTSSEYAWMRLRALLGLGDTAGFEALMASALRRFPDEPRFPRLFLERDVGGIPSDAARARGSTILARLPTYAEVDPELRALAAPLMPGQDARRDAVLAFRSMGGRSAAASLAALEYGIIDATGAAAELASGAYPLRLRDIDRAYDLAGSEAGRAAVRAALASFDGTVGADRDGDGIDEEWTRLEKGRPVEWRRDPDQDGSTILRVAFAAGLPSAFELIHGGTVIKGSFSSYPACSSLSFTASAPSDPRTPADQGVMPGAGPRSETGGRSLTRTYLFGPEGFAYMPLIMPGPDAAGFLPAPGPDGPPTERAASAFALALREAVSGTGTETLTRLDRGLPQERDSYRDGRLFARLSYDKGRPTTERVDTDGDGVFETERSYVWDGAEYYVAWVSVDTNGDGRFDYREQTRFPFRKEWDYGGKSGIDAVQFQQADGSIRREFSSRLDGELDEVIVVSGGHVSTIIRDGKRPELIPDTNPGLRWIGTKPFDLGSNLPGSEGVYTYMGVRYRIVKTGDGSFAEIIP
ncbi:MAG TPA: hypothetical protein VFL04_08320 [Rectinemataceae bacterium]|nr:hypothetical protein [Rectinemataceae bacterium]